MAGHRVRGFLSQPKSGGLFCARLAGRNPSRPQQRGHSRSLVRRRPQFAAWRPGGFSRACWSTGGGIKEPLMSKKKICFLKKTAALFLVSVLGRTFGGLYEKHSHAMGRRPKETFPILLTLDF